MSKKKSILVATIGTRDLAFQVSSQEWLNLGNDRAPDSDSISEQALVQMELGLDKSDFRLLSEYLLENWETYQSKLQPIILGKLLQDESKNLKQIYLVATDQLETPKTIKYRDKDTLYAAEIIKKWIESHYQVSTEVILQGSEGGNPADFEQMFRWWKQTWQSIAKKFDEKTPILLCVKGGVGAFSEAGRVTALSRFGENILFYDFKKDDEINRQGYASDYTIPLKGTNYLWDRKQQEALSLLKRYDYEAVGRTLQSYWRTSDTNSANRQLILRVKSLIEAATKWNTGNFQEFAEDLGESATTRQQQWWWTAYEAAYLAVVRLEQGNTVEAMFHSFRSLEGLAIKYAENQGESLYSRNVFNYLKQQKLREWNNHPYIKEIVRSEIRNKTARNDILDKRNDLFHQLQGFQEEDLYDAWKATKKLDWKNRILQCLNFISGESFAGSLEETSLMFKVHQELKNEIASYQP